MHKIGLCLSLNFSFAQAFTCRSVCILSLSGFVINITIGFILLFLPLLFSLMHCLLADVIYYIFSRLTYDKVM